MSLGFRLSKPELERAFARFKVLADKKKEIFDNDLVAIVEDELPAAQEIYKLVYVHTTSGTDTVPTATIKLSKEGKLLHAASCGDGPVDACYKAINRLTGMAPELCAYSVHSVTRGKDALGEATVKLRYRRAEVMGRGTSTDVIEASAKAYVNAINRLLAQGSERSAARRSLRP